MAAIGKIKTKPLPTPPPPPSAAPPPPAIIDMYSSDDSDEDGAGAAKRRRLEAPQVVLPLGFLEPFSPEEEPPARVADDGDYDDAAPLDSSSTSLSGMTPERVRRQAGEGTSRQAAEELPYDISQFPIPAAYKWFQNIIPQKKFIRERGLRLQQGVDDMIIQEVQRRQWTQFIRAPEAAVIRIVKEFYSMLQATDKDRTECRIRFRDTWVSFDPARINALYGISPGDGNVRLQSFTRRNLDPIAITNVICEGEVQWTMTRSGLVHKHFPLSCLSTEGLAWFKFVCSRLLPCTHVSDVTWERAVLVYAIMTRVPIDVGIFIYGAMLRTSIHRRSGLWFPSLITTLCREAGMVIEPDMETQPPASYIIPVRHEQPRPPIDLAAQSFAGVSLSRQMTALRVTMERLIRFEYKVYSQEFANMGQICEDRGFEFTPLPDFPADLFDIPGGGDDDDEDGADDDADYDD